MGTSTLSDVRKGRIVLFFEIGVIPVGVVPGDMVVERGVDGPATGDDGLESRENMFSGFGIDENDGRLLKKGMDELLRVTVAVRVCQEKGVISIQLIAKPCNRLATVL